MIDAYEIGIQLLLQDDVSSGLSVINKGLAEVDRAIAATSAHVAGLIGEAARATTAVAAAASGRVVETAVQLPPSSSSPTELPRPERIIDRTFDAETNDRAGSMEHLRTDVPKAIAPPPEIAARPLQQAAPSGAVLRASDDLLQVPVPPASVSSAPRKADEGELVPDFFLQQPAATEANGSQGEPTAPAKPTGMDTVRMQRVREPTVSAIVPATAPTPPARVAVTASVPRARAQTDLRGNAGLKQYSPQLMAASREQAVAPWTGIEQQRKISEFTQAPARAAAPPVQSREQGSSSGGTVMLDGRLVGQWLADHMAREASRPPGGTSFFDPRQAPAWNISGAL